MPTAKDLKVFVPTQDFELSIEFYTALGCKENWRIDGLAEMELGGTRFLLQKYFQKDWAHNFMMYIVIDNAQAWYEHVKQILREKKYGDARVNPPKQESHALVTYVWDPCGVLLHFAQ